MLRCIVVPDMGDRVVAGGCVRCFYSFLESAECMHQLAAFLIGLCSVFDLVWLQLAVCFCDVLVPCAAHLHREAGFALCFSNVRTFCLGQARKICKEDGATACTMLLKRTGCLHTV
jgi:hypothetical protein